MRRVAQDFAHLIAEHIGLEGAFFAASLTGLAILGFDHSWQAGVAVLCIEGIILTLAIAARPRRT